MLASIFRLHCTSAWDRTCDEGRLTASPERCPATPRVSPSSRLACPNLQRDEATKHLRPPDAQAYEVSMPARERGQLTGSQPRYLPPVACPRRLPPATRAGPGPRVNCEKVGPADQ